MPSVSGIGTGSSSVTHSMSGMGAFHSGSGHR
jgi:hypothetical protein